MIKQTCSVKLFTPLLVMLIATAFFGVFSTPVTGQTTADRTPDRIVSNEMELRNAVNNAVGTTVIALGNDITLTEQLVIPVNKDITLTSNKESGSYKLIGTSYNEYGVIVGGSSVSTITVESNGTLKFDGVSVTHTDTRLGYVITVNENGKLILCNGLISSKIGGVYNIGTFLMQGGEISNNYALNGGGVRNRGIFRMSGGEISGNSAGNDGGGVYNEDTFEMSGGEILGNSGAIGGGIYNWGGAVVSNSQYGGSFTLSGGLISGNNAWRGGGVGNQGIFVMSGGEISNNNATVNGGGVTNGQLIAQANFEMSGGKILGNTAEKGGGVYNFFNSTASLSGTGVISNNNAATFGGGICTDGTFTLVEGMILDNSAYVGGGVYVGNGDTTLIGGKVSGNTAEEGMNVFNENGNLTISSEEIVGDTPAIDGVVTICAVVVVLVVCVVAVLFFRAKKGATDVHQLYQRLPKMPQIDISLGTNSTFIICNRCSGSLHSGDKFIAFMLDIEKPLTSSNDRLFKE
jgi:predicted outer membrane repeat protein